MLPNIFNIPETEQELLVWSFANADLHTQISNKLIFNNAASNIQTFIIDPINTDDLESWAYRHQQIHNLQNQALGITGNDLTEFNIKDKVALRGWIWLHGQEMYEACQKLGLG